MLKGLGAGLELGGDAGRLPEMKPWRGLEGGQWRHPGGWARGRGEEEGLETQASVGRWIEVQQLKKID